MNETYGSTVVARLLEAKGLTNVVLNPGASTRALQDTFVHDPRFQVLLAHQENTAVALAHGYAKASGRPMVALLHDLVGLQSGSMAIFNAFIDRVPMLVLGGTGPNDASHRRPWIDWIHTTRYHNLVVRDWVKWDDEPMSVDALPESLERAFRIATAPPMGPVYVGVDVDLQELVAEYPEPIEYGSLPSTVTASADVVEEVAKLLIDSSKPVILADRAGRSLEGYRQLSALAQLIGAPVVDLGSAHNIDSTHPMDYTLDRSKAIKDADVALLLDVRDVAWAKAGSKEKSARTAWHPSCKFISVGLNGLQNRGFLDVEGVTPLSADIVAEPGTFLKDLLSVLRSRNLSLSIRERSTAVAEHRPTPRKDGGRTRGPLTLRAVASALWPAISSGPFQLANGSLRGAVRAEWDLVGFNATLGSTGGGGEGLGYGLGASIGAALHHADSDVLVVNLQTDGDFLYTPTALWTAAHHDIPLLTIVVNNQSYERDRAHQAFVATARGRSHDHIGRGIDIVHPAVDFAKLAESQGVRAWGPATTGENVYNLASEAVNYIREMGKPALLDVRVDY